MGILADQHADVPRAQGERLGTGQVRAGDHIGQAGRRDHPLAIDPRMTPGLRKSGAAAPILSASWANGPKSRPYRYPHIRVATTLGTAYGTKMPSRKTFASRSRPLSMTTLVDPPQLPEAGLAESHCRSGWPRGW